MPVEVKEIVRQAVEDGVVRRLGLRPDANAGEVRLSLAFMHPAADQADYEGAVKVRVLDDGCTCAAAGVVALGIGFVIHQPPRALHLLSSQALLPAARGRAFNRTKKRKRTEGSNTDNLCSQSVVAQLLAAVNRSAETKAGLVKWFVAAAALGPGGVSMNVLVAREPLFLYGRCVSLCCRVFWGFEGRGDSVQKTIRQRRKREVGARIDRPRRAYYAGTRSSRGRCHRRRGWWTAGSAWARPRWRRSWPSPSRR